MLKKVIAITIAVIISTVQGQGENYCPNHNLICITQAATRPESEACGIRLQACKGSNIWVPTCPKAAALRFSPEKVETVGFSVK